MRQPREPSLGEASPNSSNGRSPPGSPHKKHLRGLTDDEVREYELKVTNVLVDHPKKIMGCMCAVNLILLFICFGVLKFSLSDSDFKAINDIRTRVQEGQEGLVEMVELQEQKRTAVQAQELLRSVPLAGFQMIYDGEGDNVLTLSNMKFVKSTEDMLLNHENYKQFCVLEWFPTDSIEKCPGSGCPALRTNWDYTSDSLMPDGSKVVCKAPTLSVSWLMWNYRVVKEGDANKTECNAETEFDVCVSTGTYAHISDLGSRTAGEKQSLIEGGGITPTEKELELWVRVAHRLIFVASDPRYSFIRFFFDKNFGKGGSMASTFVRSTLQFGGPMERADPRQLSQSCHSRTTQQLCEAASTHCEWSTKTGNYQNTVGCMAKQWDEVSTIEDSSSTEDQRTDFSSWFAHDITKDFDDLDGPVDVLYLAQGTLFQKFMDVLIRDSMLASLSFVFVYLYIQVHTGSFLLATLGMIQVLMPFPFAYFVYKGILGIKAFYGLSTLALFIVLAIGADDIFVFFDAWQQADIRPRDDTCVYLKGRLAYAWKQSGTAMGITSVTTMCAFIATMSSPLWEIKYFGTFAALLVFFDYLFVMTFFAASVVVAHRTTENAMGCCMCGKQLCGSWFSCCTCYTEELPVDCEECPGIGQTRLSRPRTFETLEDARAKLGYAMDFTPVPTHKALPSAEQDKEVIEMDKEYKHRRMMGFALLFIAAVVYATGTGLLGSYRKTHLPTTWVLLSTVGAGLALFCFSMNAFRSARDRMHDLGITGSDETVFTLYIAPFLSGTGGPGANICLRMVPAIILIAVWIALVVQATKLEKTKDTEQWMPKWHPVQRYFDAWSEEFPESNQAASVRVTLAFGLEADDPVDRSVDSYDKWEKNSKGDPRFYAGKQTGDYTTEAFQRYMKAICQKVHDESVKGRKLQRVQPSTPPSPTDGLEDQNCFMNGFEKYSKTVGWVFPSPQAEFATRLHNYTLAQRAIVKRGIELHAADVHFDKVLFAFDETTKAATDVRAVMMYFNTTLKEMGSSSEELHDYWDEWDAFEEELQDGQSAWIKTHYATGYRFKQHITQGSAIWVWMNTQDVLVKGAITGTLVSLSLAFVVVFFGTMNFLIAILVAVELVGVVGFVLGTMKLLDWQLGMIECVTITVLVGLSVDYVVHFAIHYSHCDVQERDELGVTERQRRVHQAAAEMGPTVLGGAATSCGASIPLLLCWVQFFHKFGVCFLCTISYSYLWATFFFLPVMSLIGPQGNFMSIRPCLARCFPRVFGEDKHKKEDSPDQYTGDAEMAIVHGKANLNMVAANGSGSPRTETPPHPVNQVFRQEQPTRLHHEL